jgi:NAD(P)H-dependent FMN reductase
VTDLRLLFVSGSTRDASTNTAALRTLAALAPDGMRADLFGSLAALPAFDPDAVDEPPTQVADLHAAIATADVVVFSAPEYAGALPGSFKNLLDWTIGTADLSEKPVAWLDISAEGRGAGAAAELATVLAYVGAVVLEAACLRLPVPRDAVGADGTISDEPTRAALRTMLADLAEAL